MLLGSEDGRSELAYEYSAPSTGELLTPTLVTGELTSRLLKDIVEIT